MKIKLTQSLAGEQVLPAGTVIETSEKEAESLVNAGFAVYFEDEEIKTTESKGFASRKTTAKRR